MASVESVKQRIEAGRQSLAEAPDLRAEADEFKGDMNQVRRHGRDVSEKLEAGVQQARDRVAELGGKAVQASAKGEEAGGHFTLALEGSNQTEAVNNLFRYVGGLEQAASRYPAIVERSNDGLDKVKAGLAMVLEGVIGITEAVQEASSVADDVEANRFMADRTAQDIIEGL